MKPINQPISKFMFVCWYQPFYIWQYDNTMQWHMMHSVGITPATKQTDYGPMPFTTNIENATIQNTTFRTSLWTGDHLQLVLMSIGVGEDIGLEIHSDVDQFIRIEQGEGLVQMGPEKNRLRFERHVSDDDIILIPAGTWHNLTNTGTSSIKLYTIYAPPEHPYGTVHQTKDIAMEMESDLSPYD